MKIASAQIQNYSNHIYTQEYDVGCCGKSGFDELLCRHKARQEGDSHQGPYGHPDRRGRSPLPCHRNSVEDFLTFSTSKTRHYKNHTNPVISPFDSYGGHLATCPDNDLVTPERHKWKRNPASEGRTREEVCYETVTTNLVNEGRVKTIDGRTIDFFYTMSLTRESYLFDNSRSKNKGSEASPLVINFDGKAPRFSDATVEFDLDGDGTKEDVSTLRPGSGFLSLDLNGDGIINDGSELFGMSGRTGFDELRKYDLDNNLWIDENDDIFDQLTILEINDQGEMTLTKLKETGVGAIYLMAGNNPFEAWDASSIALNEDGTVSSIHAMNMSADNEKSSSAPPYSVDRDEHPNAGITVQGTGYYQSMSFLKTFYKACAGTRPQEVPFYSSELKQQFSGILKQYVYESVSHYTRHQAVEIAFNHSQIFDTIDRLWGNDA